MYIVSYNSNKLNLQGKVRARTQEIPTRSVDCVLSVGALSRSSAVDETLQEVYRSGIRAEKW